MSSKLKVHRDFKLKFAFFIFIFGLISFPSLGYSSSSNDGPSLLYAHSMVFDPIQNQLILFGSRTMASSSPDYSTWLYHLSNNTWTPINTPIVPRIQENSGMVYDPSTNRVIYFGGGETWAFDPSSNAWTKLSPENSPPNLADFSMHYDENEQKIVIYGGHVDPNFVLKDATWIFNPQTENWVQLTTNTPPQARYGHAMVYDTNAKLGILFGGRVSGLSSETWSLNLTEGTWQKKSPNTTPLSRYWFSMVFDSHLGQSLLFGGDNEESPIRALGDTWCFNGSSSSTWTEFSPDSTPSPRTGHAMAFASSTNKTYLFGGLGEDYSVNYGDLWSYDSTDSKWEPLSTDFSSESDENGTISFGFIFLGISLLSIILFLRKKTKTQNKMPKL
ncbi:N-acetylneuraminate epimerase [Candidatus Lokiarchaeum ossiferum]|uniref:N-acetylneuraminate epimerase n=1 Tax=Candidatus Lokiarchaeum ossiferum TaxID=2951803 RepID=A0ABY6HTU4_9ARCH|nr:N-acetylneuraminate epimerase [Candidatus Lokiarchaeum sp. B-35]